jgi:ligand-binding SRPBCC domain-containing protein
MTYQYSLHIEAPVGTVFDFFKDPANWAALASGGVEFRDVVLTREGLGTHYGWRARLLGIPLQGLNVFTEFVPNRRITDRSSSSLEGTWTYDFAPEGSGTRLTVANQMGSFWRFRPLEHVLDRLAGTTHEPRFAALKAMLEESRLEE